MNILVTQTQARAHIPSASPGEYEDELVRHDLVLAEDLVPARGLDTQLQRVHRGHRRRVVYPGAQHLLMRRLIELSTELAQYSEKSPTWALVKNVY